MVSTISRLPILVPFLRWAACGARLMLSWPPATTMRLSPFWIAWQAMATDLRPEPQSMLTL